MKCCANCHKPIGLNARALPRVWDWAVFRWLVFHHRNCKREWKAQRQQERARQRAVRMLYNK